MQKNKVLLQINKIVQKLSSKMGKKKKKNRETVHAKGNLNRQKQNKQLL